LKIISIQNPFRIETQESFALKKTILLLAVIVYFGSELLLQFSDSEDKKYPTQ